MVKDYSVLDGIKYNQDCEIQTAFDKGYKQGYDEAMSKNLEQIRKEEYKKGYEAGQKEANADVFISGIREQAREEIWDALKATFNMNGADFNKTFSCGSYVDVLEKYSPSEILQKIREYENSLELKEKLKFLNDFCTNKNRCSNCILNTDEFNCGHGGAWTETSYKYAGDVDKAIEIVKKNI